VTSGTSLTAAAASIVGRHTQAASLESISATTTYHRKTVDGVGIFYREAGPNDAPTIVLLHGFPSSSREFDTLIPLLATRHHLIAPDFPGFGLSDAPPPSSYAYTFDNLARTINGLLEQLKIKKYTFHLHDYGGPVGFRIILAHPERLQALIIQNANAYKEGLGAKWAGIAQYWADPKAHPEVFDAFVSLTATEHVTPSAPRIPNVTTRTPGPTSTPTCRDPASARYKPICCTTTGQTSLRTRRGKRGCASTSRRFWWSGGGTIPRSSLPARRRSSVIFRTAKSTCSMPATSPWTRRTTTSRVSFLRSWPNIRSD
jgi:pimeloyl-ACP methyl ester carboxylesterase